jgi:hypothetical protein
MAFCTKCGQVLEEGAKFCAKCGTRTDMPPVTETQSAGAFGGITTQQQPLQGKNPTVKILAIVAGVIVVLAGVWLCLSIFPGEDVYVCGVYDGGGKAVYWKNGQLIELPGSGDASAERGSQNNIKMAVKTTLSPITQCAMPLQSRTPK